MELTQVKHEIETLAEKHRMSLRRSVHAYLRIRSWHTMKRWRRISYAGCWKSMALKYSGEPALWRPHLWQNTGAESRE